MWHKVLRIGLFVIIWAGGSGLGCREKVGPASSNQAPQGEKGRVTRIIVLGPERRTVPAGATVYDVGRHDRPRWEGLAGEEFSLPRARYDILLEYFGQKYWLPNEELAGGEKVVTLPMAVLSVEVVSSRGDRLGGEVEVFAGGSTGSALPLIAGETGEELMLLAGTCDVRVLVQGRERWLRGLSLAEGDRVTEKLIEPVGYVLAEVVDQRGELLNADVWVYDPKSQRQPVAWGRAGERMAVVPGRYDVTVRYGEERDSVSALTVMANQTTKEVFTFFRGSGVDGE